MRRDPGSVQRLLAGVVACLVLAGVVGLAVVADAQDRDGRADVGSLAVPADADGDTLLGEVRRFVAEKRTARFNRLSEWSFDEGDGEPVEPERLTARGELRLPSEAHAVAQYEDGSVEEAIVHVEDRFVREAGTGAELDLTQWEDASDVRFVANDAGVVSEIAEFGLPVRLDTLLGGLRRATRLSEGRVQGRYELEEVIDGEPGVPIGEGRATVTVEFSGDGRLDGLTLEIVQEHVGETTTQRDAYRFSEWGAPVAFTLPDRSAVAAPPGAGATDGFIGHEEALARRVTVFAPSDLPNYWDTQGRSSSTVGDGVAVCGYFTLRYGPGDDTRLAVASASTGTCEVTPIRPEQLAGATPITIGDKRGWLLHDVTVAFTELTSRMIVVDIGTTRVVAVTNESQAFLESVVRSLVPAEPLE